MQSRGTQCPSKPNSPPHCPPYSCLAAWRKSFSLSPSNPSTRAARAAALLRHPIMRYTPYKIPQRPSASEELLQTLALTMFSLLGAICLGLVVHFIIKAI